MAGSTLESLRQGKAFSAPPVNGGHVSVKEAVLPFTRFPDADTLLGPEMRSTGEVMGIDSTFGLAFAKSQAAAGDELPTSGAIFFSLADRDKPTGVGVARRFVQLGFSLAATSGTAAYFEEAGVPVETRVAKVSAEDSRAWRAADAVALPRRQGEPGREHAARPGPPSRRGLHPPGGQPAPGRLPDQRSPPPAPRWRASPTGPTTP